MNKRRERPPLSDRGRRRALRTWGFYLLALTAWVTVVLAAVLYLWPVEIMDLLSNNHELSVLGAPYLKLIGISYVFNMLSSLYVSARRSAEDAGFGMKLFAMSTVLNTGLNYLLIFGKFGFPEMGIAGAPHHRVRRVQLLCRPQQAPAHPVAGLLPPRLGNAPAVREVLLPRDPQ